MRSMINHILYSFHLFPAFVSRTYGRSGGRETGDETVLWLGDTLNPFLEAPNSGGLSGWTRISPFLSAGVRRAKRVDLGEP